MPTLLLAEDQPITRELLRRLLAIEGYTVLPATSGVDALDLLNSGASIVALIKPQFEVGKGKVGKGGVVRSHQEHMRVVDEISAAARGLGYHVGGVIESPLLGPKGNKEFFIYLKDAGDLQ